MTYKIVVYQQEKGKISFKDIQVETLEHAMNHIASISCYDVKVYDEKGCVVNINAEPKVEEPKVKEPKVEETKVEETKVEEPKPNKANKKPNKVSSDNTNA
jgi:hypothetical protein